MWGIWFCWSRYGGVSAPSLEGVFRPDVFLSSWSWCWTCICCERCWLPPEARLLFEPEPGCMFWVAGGADCEGCV